MVSQCCVGKESQREVANMQWLHLNKACPKDSYPLPWIDQLVDATVGHELLSFMDAFSEYNQIYMVKISFITDHGLFC